MATVQIEKRRRGIFGWIIAILFWGFNLLMALWLWAAFSVTSTVVDGATSDAEKAGAMIGAGIGVTMVIWVWLFGAVILGIMMLFTRGRKEIITVER